MARRDDKIFKNLKKEKPLVKRKDITPLTASDFGPRKSAFDLQVEKKSQQKRNARPAVRPVSIRSATGDSKRKSASNAKKATDLASRYSARTQKKTEPEVFGPSGKQRVVKAEPKKVEQRKHASVRQVEKTTRKAAPKKQEIEMPLSVPARKDSGVSTFVSRKATNESVKPVASKGLTFRHELKYYINYRDYVVLRNALKASMSLDANAGDDGMYHIRSLYFDDMYETGVKQKIAGTDDRCKYRIRIYDFSDGVIKFEKKIKQGQYIAKQSISLTRAEYESIIAGDYEFLLTRKQPLAGEIYTKMKNDMLRPRVLVDYQREAYVYPFENVRITFDKNLRGGLTMSDIFNEHAPTMPMFDQGLMVLEVKFNKFLPECIKCVLNSISTADRSAISKYIICRKFD